MDGGAGGLQSLGRKELDTTERLRFTKTQIREVKFLLLSSINLPRKYLCSHI